MGKIDTAQWGAFTVGTLFEAVRGKVNGLQTQDEGNIPVIAAARTKQGVAGYYNVSAPFSNKITVSCNGVGCGSTFYHPYSFNINGDAIVLTELQPMTYKIKQFIACMLDGVLMRKYSYEEKCSPDKVKTEIIKLPVGAEGNPDWQYMEDYMRNLETTVSDSLTKLLSVKEVEHIKVDSSAWVAFDIVKCFDLSLPKGDIQVKGLDIGNTPLITPSGMNNGLFQCIPEDSKSTLYDTNALTVDMFGNAYYQDEKFFVTAHGHVNVLKPKLIINKYIGLFMASAIKSMFMQKYGFSDMCTQKVLKAEKIYLPVDAKGEPDWQYMEQYMKTMEQKAKQTLDSLSS